MSIRIQNPVLREHLSAGLFKYLQDHLPDNTKQDDALLRRYEAQVHRGIRITHEINEEAAKRGIKCHTHFILDDDIAKLRVTRGHKPRPHESELKMGFQKVDEHNDDPEYYITGTLSFMELLDDEEAKGIMAHELGHLPTLSAHLVALENLEKTTNKKKAKIRGGRFNLLGMYRLMRIEDALDLELKQQKDSLELEHDQKQYEIELQADRFAGDFTGNRFAFISALEKMYKYDLEKIEEERDIWMEPEYRKKWEAWARHVTEFSVEPDKHPNATTRITEQRLQIKLLPPGSNAR